LKVVFLFLTVLIFIWVGAPHIMSLLGNNKYKSRRFENKVALISGSTQGIGLAIADRLGTEGAKVVISSRNQANIDEALQWLVSQGIPKENVAGTKCHVGKDKDRKRLVDFTIETFHKIDILVNAAGVNPAVGNIMDVSGSQFDKIFETNVKAGFMLTRLVVPHMERNGGGVVIFNGSVGAYLTGSEITVYGMSKTALLALVQALSTELAPKNIRVNSVVPGIIRAGMSRLMWDKNHPKYNQASESAKGVSNLIGRIGEPSEIASAVAYLACSDSSYVTGENHLVIGGVDCRL
jgi:dehydrogenase/reductase SDR family protein 4